MPFVPDDFHAPLELTTDRVALEAAVDASDAPARA